ncbi:MAG: ethanolamine ammonia-lyase reactivating factor EutA [Thaumarchaeota archaeon]|nr:ethanolamine ammonia-lyase reactivating factor EutA [Nitrososphaerota archaeon]
MTSSSFKIKSVGIDIGSSTSSLMFSSITLAKPNYRPESKLEPIERIVTYRSKVLLTPYLDGFKTIDTNKLGKFISNWYLEAGEDPGQIDTGAVIITGEAANKANAKPIMQLFSEQAGKFVCAVAGPNLEAVLAAHGSGAVARSLAPHFHGDDEHQHPRTIMNVDVGGGTTKVAVIHGGQIVYTSAISVGARLLSVDAEGKVERIEDAARIIAADSGVGTLDYGMRLTDREKQLMSSALADALMSFIIPGRELTPVAKKLLITENGKHDFSAIDAIMFSGGVSEFIYERDSNDYGDLGKPLADEIRRRVLTKAADFPVEEPDEFLRATVIGASQYSFQISGNTIYLSNEEVLPIHNVPISRIELGAEEKISPAVIKERVVRAIKIFDQNDQRGELIGLGLDNRILGYEGLKKYALGLKEGFDAVVPAKVPIILISKENLGGSLGRILAEDLKIQRDVISIDEIDLKDLNYVDIGNRISNSGSVHVTVKSLIFQPHLHYQHAKAD